jgi:hypothetical protein
VTRLTRGARGSILLVMSSGPATAAPSHQIDYLYTNARELGYLPEWVRWT